MQNIVCISVNDPFVMEEWGKALKCEGKVRMVADPTAEFSTALGMAKDMPPLGGVRSSRYALLIEDGKITQMAFEPKGIDKTSAESMLELLGCST